MREQEERLRRTFLICAWAARALGALPPNPQSILGKMIR